MNYENQQLVFIVHCSEFVNSSVLSRGQLGSNLEEVNTNNMAWDFALLSINLTFCFAIKGK
ncbi:hypothetical protein HC931_17770 [Candidatus Gracilibacteria bacterium]|nr:hypothetical protein [Candidatus Gracilibacteria bacterium]